jgi:FAD/FMN-containing dehydrogenase
MAPSAAMSDPFLEKLRGAVRGQVLADEKDLRRYSRDESIYEIRPRAVVLPEDVRDVQRLAAFAEREGVPVTPRGGGSGLAGGALGEGIVLALPENEHWGRISCFSAAAGSAWVSAAAGVRHDDLQRFLKERGFFLPADVSSAGISRIGGNIATRASGPHALKFGSIDRFVERVEFVTAGGEMVDTADERTIPEGISRALADLRRRITADEEARAALGSRRGLKTASGYDLPAFLDGLSPGRLIARLLVGSVGTLGLITSAVLRAEALLRERAAVLLFFDDLGDAVLAAGVLRDQGAAAVELISRETIRIIARRTDLPRDLAADGHVLLAELTGPAGRDLAGRAAKLVRDRGYALSAPPVFAVDEDRIEELWELRRRLLWLVRHPEPGLRALTVVNDVAVPPDRLAAFMADVQKVFAGHGMTALVYGHAGNGNLHLRPLFDLSQPGIGERIRRLADEVYEAVFRHNGTVTAEHGMGRLRAPYLRREWGDRLYGYMKDVKAAFDPRGVLNPEVMFSDRPITDHLREDLLRPREEEIRYAERKHFLAEAQRPQR